MACDDIWRYDPQLWKLVTDTVMGGVSKGTIAREVVSSRDAVRMRGDVSTAQNGGFIQMALDFATDAKAFNASAFNGVEIDVFGNLENYNVHLRTTLMTRPQQSYRYSFSAGPVWQTIRVSFSDFIPNRIDAALDPRSLRRIGLVAIGRDFAADLSVARLGFY